MILHKQSADQDDDDAASVGATPPTTPPEYQEAVDNFEAEEAARAKAIQEETHPNFDGLKQAETDAWAHLQEIRRVGDQDAIKAASKKLKVHKRNKSN